MSGCRCSWAPQSGMECTWWWVSVHVGPGWMMVGILGLCVCVCVCLFCVVPCVCFFFFLGVFVCEVGKKKRRDHCNRILFFCGAPPPTAGAISKHGVGAFGAWGRPPHPPPPHTIDADGPVVWRLCVAVLFPVKRSGQTLCAGGGGGAERREGEMESLPRHNPGSNIPNPLALAHAVLLGGDEVAHSILFYVNGRRFQACGGPFPPNCFQHTHTHTHTHTHFPPVLLTTQGHTLAHTF